MSSDEEFKRTVFDKFEKHDKRITANEIALTSHVDVAKVIEGRQKEDHDDLKSSIKELSKSITDADYVKRSDLKDVKTSLSDVSEEVKKTITFKQLVAVATVFIILLGFILSGLQWISRKNVSTPQTQTTTNVKNSTN